MPLFNQKKRVLRTFNKYSAIFLAVYIFVFYNLLAQQFDIEANNQTQDWIFGDGPEPKWVIELLHGAYQNIKEDSKYILKVPITGSGIKYSASVDGNATIEKDGDYLIISPYKNYNGKILVNLNLDMSFILNVQSINDLPIISEVKKQSINEDEVFHFKLNAEDAENDQLTYGATVDGNATVKVVNDNLTIIPKNNYFGPINVNLAVSDGKATDETSFILDVKPINDAPILKSIFSSSKSKNNRVDLLLSGSDIDGDNLIYSVKGDGETDFEIKDNKITVKPSKNYKGSTPITLTTSDGNSQIDTSFTLINPIPGVTAFAPQSMLEDSFLVLILNIEDIEKDPFTYRLKKNDNARLEINDNELKIFPKKDFFGKLPLMLNISDGLDSTDFSFSINVIPIPDPPIAVAGDDIVISDGCNSKIYLDGGKSWDADSDITSYEWEIIGRSGTILNQKKGYYYFNNENEHRDYNILLTVSDFKGLIGYDTINVKIINDSPPIADAGIDFIAPFNKKVLLDGSRTVDKDSDIIYKWNIISGDVSFSKEQEIKQNPYFIYPPEINKLKKFIAVLEVKDYKSYCFSYDTVIVTCLPNVDMVDNAVKYEIVRANKLDNKVFIDLNVTNKQSWPFDFAAFTLVSVKNEKNHIGQIDPYRGKNTVKYGIENDEKVNVELVYNFDSPPKEVSIICKSTMAIKGDSVFFKQEF